MMDVLKENTTMIFYELLERWVHAERERIRNDNSYSSHYVLFCSLDDEKKEIIQRFKAARRQDDDDLRCERGFSKIEED